MHAAIVATSPTPSHSLFTIAMTVNNDIIEVAAAAVAALMEIVTQ